MRKTLPVLLCLFSSSAALAGVIQVPRDFPNIQAAIDSASAGDTVRVHSGTYPENLMVKGKESLTIFGEEGPEETIIDGGEKGPVMQLEDCRGAISISGLTLRNGYSDVNGGGLVARRSEVHVRDCRFLANRAENSGGGLSILDSPRYGVRDCLFESNVCNDEASAVSIIGGRGDFTGNTIRKNTGALAFVLIQAGCDVRGNVIVDNLCTEFGAIAYQIALSAVVEGNTIARNRGKEGLGAVLVQFGDLRIERNIISENAGVCGIQVDTRDDLVRLAGNNVWQNEGGPYLGTAPGDGDIAADPLFCDLEQGDFRLRAGSPCLPGANGTERIGALGEGCPERP